MGFMHPDDGNDQACVGKSLGLSMRFVGSLTNCVFVDINECQMFNNLCVYGTCENTFGMFRCQCHDGYTLDHSGGNCTDVDECKSPQSCLYGQCSNMEGSFRCLCPSTHSLVSEGNACIGNWTVCGHP